VLIVALVTFAPGLAAEPSFWLETVSFSPLWTTFVHILDQWRGLSKGKFQQILQKEWLSVAGGKKYNGAGCKRLRLQGVVFTWLIQGERDLLVNEAKLRQER
jgi:hypothetical protein